MKSEYKNKQIAKQAEWHRKNDPGPGVIGELPQKMPGTALNVPRGKNKYSDLEKGLIDLCCVLGPHMGLMRKKKRPKKPKLGPGGVLIPSDTPDMQLEDVLPDDAENVAQPRRLN